MIFWLDDTLLRTRARWRTVRWLPWICLGLMLLSLLTSAWRGPQ